MRSKELLDVNSMRLTPDCMMLDETCLFLLHFFNGGLVFSILEVNNSCAMGDLTIKGLLRAGVFNSGDQQFLRNGRFDDKRIVAAPAMRFNWVAGNNIPASMFATIIRNETLNSKQ
eukprot:scaffold26498_cov108-Cylindrotheca_fusiformis.AAC.2